MRLIADARRRHRDARHVENDATRPPSAAAGRRRSPALGARRALPAARAVRRSSVPPRPTSTRSRPTMDGTDVSTAPPPTRRRRDRLRRRHACGRRRWRVARQPPGAADRRRRGRRCGGGCGAAVRGRRRRRVPTRPPNAGDDGAGGGVGQGAERGAHPQLDRVHRPDRGRSDRGRSTASATPPGSPSTTPRRSTTTTRCTPRSSPPTSTPATPRRRTSPAHLLDGGPAQEPGLARAPLPFNLIPNYVNLDPQYLNLGWDLGRQVQPAVAGRVHRHRLQPDGHRPRADRASTTSSTPSSRARSGCFTEMRDTVGLAMLGLGQRPGRAPTEETMNQALDKIEEATDSNGRSVASPATTTCRTSRTGTSPPASPGPATSPRPPTPTSTSSSPRRGRCRWFDTMVIPIGAPNGVAAAAWMNFVYDPVNAAQITAYVQYVSPGPRRAGGADQDGRRRRRPRRQPAAVPRRRHAGEHATCSPTCRRSSTSRSPTASSRSPGV